MTTTPDPQSDRTRSPWSVRRIFVAVILAGLLPASVAVGATPQQGTALPAQSTQGNGAEPPWPAEAVATLRSFLERVDVEEVLEGVRRPPASVLPPVADDWSGPYLWVQQRVAFEPYFGSLRGAAGTMSSMSGNALDQSLLLIEMYRVRGERARLVRGQLAWDDAVRLVGPGEGRLRAGDPWLRRVEQTSDHWWVELRREGRWVALDPSFPGSPPDAVRGSRRAAYQEVPPQLRATIELSIRNGEDRLWSVNRTAASLAGSTLRLAARHPGVGDPASGRPEEVRPGSEGANLPTATDPAATVAEALPIDFPGLAPMLREALAPLPDGDVTLALSSDGDVLGTVSVPPEALPQIELHVRAFPPIGNPTSLAVAWSGGRQAEIVVFVAAGAHRSAALRSRARALYSSLASLSEAERDAQLAFDERPEATVDGRRLAPRLPSRPELRNQDRGQRERSRALQALEPWERLHLAAIEAWRDFELWGLEALGHALIATVDRLAPAGRVSRPGVRLLAVQWAPPEEQAGGRLSVWVDDVVVLTGGAGREELQAAHDLLYSALIGQVLNRVADSPPVSAFDVTLRTVGTGSRLSWWNRAPELPNSWPMPARRAAAADLAAGTRVVGPPAPIAVRGQPLLGWWAYAPRTGMIAGRIVTPGGVAQGSVGFLQSRDLADLESALASLPDLHQALRWLILAGDPDSAALSDLVPRACAATALVRDLMLAGAPGSWRDPDFAAFCINR